MIRIVRSGEPRELLGVLCPVEVTAVDDAAADAYAVAVNILCCGVGNDVSAPLKGTAVDGSCEGVVNNKRNTVRMCKVRKFLEVKN